MGHVKLLMHWTRARQRVALQIENGRLPDCDYGHFSQTIFYIVKECPIHTFKESMQELHSAMDEAINWIKTQDIKL